MTNLKILVIVFLFLIISCGKQDITEQTVTDYIKAKNLYLQGDMDNAFHAFLDIRDKAPLFLPG